MGIITEKTGKVNGYPVTAGIIDFIGYQKTEQMKQAKKLPPFSCGMGAEIMR